MAKSPDDGQCCSFRLHFVQYFPDDWSSLKEVPRKSIAYFGECLNVVLEATIETPQENGNVGHGQRELYRKQSRGQQCLSYIRRVPSSTLTPSARPKQEEVDAHCPDGFQTCTPLLVMYKKDISDVKKYKEVHLSENVILFPVCLPLENLPLEPCKLTVVMEPPWVISRPQVSTVTQQNSPQTTPNDHHHQTFQPKVCASLELVGPPHTCCRHLTVGDKHYTIVQVSNKYGEAITIEKATIMVNRNNHFLPPSPDGSTYQSTPSNVTDFIEASTMPTSSSTQLPLVLQALEQNCFIFQLDILDNISIQDDIQSLDVPLLFSLQWKPYPVAQSKPLLAHYELPTIRLDYPAFVMLAKCNSPVTIGESFSVQYTLVNKLQDFIDIGLMWLPAPRLVGDSGRRENGSIEDVVLCQEPVQHVGTCKLGSTATITFVFKALKCGLYELGKFMKLKLQYASSNPNRPSSSHDHLLQHSQSTPALKELTGENKAMKVAGTVPSSINGNDIQWQSTQEPIERIPKIISRKDNLLANQRKGSLNVNKITKRRCQVYIMAKQS
ncbi:microtubule-associated protein 11-like [Anneissia japonica]|uniref:microtubule-associated protein 11-like n=1 Tax=Anneissia japonica TaxID=1529436 RepID=UPI0014255FB8|nr:microtubule-associated protein 11-like [Anneissia japonica]